MQRSILSPTSLFTLTLAIAATISIQHGLSMVALLSNPLAATLPFVVLATVSVMVGLVAFKASKE
jgi:hypothetical protein